MSEKDKFVIVSHKDPNNVSTLGEFRKMTKHLPDSAKMTAGGNFTKIVEIEVNTSDHSVHFHSREFDQ